LQWGAASKEAWGSVPSLAFAQDRQKHVAVQLERVFVDELQVGAEISAMARTVNSSVGEKVRFFLLESRHENHAAKRKGSFFWIWVAFIERRGCGVVILDPMKASTITGRTGINLYNSIMLLRFP